jgi:hypothetical protein
LEYDQLRIGINDAFIVKYKGPSMKSSDSEFCGQQYLPLHFDQSSHSFIIALNDCTEYTGGGTYFPSLHMIARPGR